MFSTDPLHLSTATSIWEMKLEMSFHTGVGAAVIGVVISVQLIVRSFSLP